MNQFPTFHSIDSLTIDFDESPSRNATIYGNGLHQVRIIIKLSLLDVDGKKLRLDDCVLKDAVYLCDYYTGEKIPTDTSTNNFYYSEKNNGFCTSISRISPSTLHPDTFAVTYLYISSNAINSGKLISCGITIKDIGDVDTSENGTSSKLPNGSTYRHQNSVTVNSIAPIDYSDKNNISMIVGDFEEISDNLGWTSRLGSTNISEEHQDGTCKRRFLYIKPNLNTNQRAFKKHTISYDPVQNEDCSIGNVGWNGYLEHGFDVIQGFGYPCAVIGRGASRDNYQMNFWFSLENNITLDGHLFFHDTNYTYRFCPFAHEDHCNENESGYGALVLYKFILPENNLFQDQWHDCIRSTITVNVTDHSGNHGSFKLIFNDSEYFDVPGWSID